MTHDPRKFYEDQERRLIDEAVAKGMVRVIPMGMTSDVVVTTGILFGKGKRTIKKSTVRSAVLSKASAKAVKDTGI